MPLNTLTAKLKTIYKAQDTLSKLIEDKSIPSQRMDEYYVALRMIMDNAGEKQDIQVREMFDAIDKQPIPDKVLILGRAGVGKTTFLHHVSYEWGSDKIYQDKFDFIFKVKLKKLASDDMRSMLLPLSKVDRLVKLVALSLEDQQGELKERFKKMAEQEKLALLEHIGATQEEYLALLNEELNEPLSLEEIKTSLAAKTLLLLDGYDEIAHLDRSSSSVVYHVMQKIFDYKIIMTSRPNALSSDKERQFNRKIESAGLDQNGAREYIDKFFTKQQEMLLTEVDSFFVSGREIASSEIKMSMESHFKKKKATLTQLQEIFKDYEPTCEEMVRETIKQYFHSIQTSLAEMFISNAHLREVISTPINAALLCLVSSDPASRTKLQGNLNAGTLYQEAVIWLGKRYAHKYGEINIRDLTANGVFNIPELVVLKHIAYNEFNSGRTIISGEIIATKAEAIIGVAAIRKVNEFGLLKPETAAKDQSEENDNDDGDDADGVDAADDADDLINRDHAFIHLSFQEYLSAYALKEKLMSNADIDVSPHASHGSHISSSRISSSSSSSSSYSPKSHGLHNEGSELTKESQKEYSQAAEFIATHRNEPRYLMTFKFLAGLVTNEQAENTQSSQNSQNSQILVTRFWEAMTCNVDGVLELGAERKVTLLMHLLEQAKIGEELDPRIPNLNKIVDFIDVVVLQDLLNWSEQIQTSGYLSLRMGTGLIKMLNGDFAWSVEDAVMNWNINNQRVRETNAIEVVSSIGEIEDIGDIDDVALDKIAVDDITQKPLSIEAFEIKGNKQASIEDNIANDQLDQLILASTKARQKQKDTSAETKMAIIMASNLAIKLDKVTEEKATLQAINQYIENKETHWQVKKVAIASIIEIYRSRGIKIELNEAIQRSNQLLNALSNANLRKEALEAFKAVKTIIALSEVPNIAAAITIEELLLPMLSNENAAGYAAEAISKIAAGTSITGEIATRTIEQLLPLLSNGDAARYAAEAIIIIATGSGITSETAIDLLLPMLSNKNAAEYAAEAISKIAASGGTTGEIATRAIEQLLPTLSNENTAYYVAQIISKIAAGSSSTGEIATRAIELLLPLLSNRDAASRYAAIAIGSIAAGSSSTGEIATRAIELLLPMLSNKDTTRNAAQAISKIATGSGSTGEIATRAIDLLLPMLSNEDAVVRTAITIGEIAARTSISGEIATKAIELLLPALSNKNAAYYVVEAIVAITDGGDITGEVAIRIIELLLPMLSDENAAEHAAGVISMIAAGTSITSEVAIRIIELLLPMLSDKNAAEYAAGIISMIAAGASSAGAMTTRTIELLLPMLSNEDVAWYAAQAIGEIVSRASISSEIATRAIELLLPMLSDENAAEHAAIAIGSIAAGSSSTGEIATRAIEQLLPLLSNGDTARSAAIAIGSIAAGSSSTGEIATRAIELLLPLLSNGDTAAYVAIAIGEIVARASITGEIATRVIELLLPMLSDENAAWCVAGAISKIATRTDSTGEIVIRIIELLLPLLSNKNAAWCVVGAISKIATRTGSTGEIATRAIELLLPLLSNGDAAKSAAIAIGSVAAGTNITGEIATRAIERLLPLLSNRDAAVHVAIAIGEIATGTSITGGITTRAIELLLPMLSDEDDAVHAAIAIGEIAAGASITGEIATRTIELLLPMLSNENAAECVDEVISKIAAKMTIDKLAKALTSTGVTAQNAQVENIFIAALTIKLNELSLQELPQELPQESLQELQANEMELTQAIKTGSVTDAVTKSVTLTEAVTSTLTSMLMIIGREIGNLDANKQILHDIARKILDKQVAILNQLNLISWINESFDNFIALSTESKRMMSDIYRSVLSDGEISADDSEFIINCITKLGLTTTVTRPQGEGDNIHFSILFGKDIYALIGINNLKYLESITRAALSSSSDILAKQYNTHEPLFLNSNSGMKLAASDILDVVSIVDGANLDNHHWHLSLMHLSDHHQSEPTGTTGSTGTTGITGPTSKFLIIERRDEFGYYEAHKFTIDVTGSTIRGDTLPLSFTIYPRAVNLEYRKAIFGDMPYNIASSIKPRYYATTLDLDLDSGIELIGSSIKSIGTSTILKDTIAYGSTSLESLILAPWSEYIAQPNIQEYKKVQLLDLSEQNTDLRIKLAAESTRRDSFKIQATESIADLNQLKQKLKNINFDNLETILNREQCSKQQQAILNALDPYQNSFYEVLIMQLNAMYVATSSINSQLIDSNGSNQAATGKIGSFLQSVAPHVPLVGLGVQMIGAVMTKVDKNNQQDAIANYATIVGNSVDMAKLASYIAISLAPHARDLKIPEEETATSMIGGAIDRLTQAVSASDTAVQVISTIRTLDPVNMIGSLDVVALAANAIGGIKTRIHEVNEVSRREAASASSASIGSSASSSSNAPGASSTQSSFSKYADYTEKLLFGVEQSAEDTEVSDGQTKGIDIAAFIIKQIFEKKITADNNRDAVIHIQSIVGFISQEFGLQKPIIDELSPVTIIDPIKAPLASTTSTGEAQTSSLSSTAQSTKVDKSHPVASSQELSIADRRPPSTTVQQLEDCSIVSYVTQIKYNNANLLLNQEGLIYAAAQINGIKTINSLIEPGEDQDENEDEVVDAAVDIAVSKSIVDATQKYDAKHTLNILFTPISDYAANSQTNSQTLTAITDQSQQTLDNDVQAQVRAQVYDDSYVNADAHVHVLDHDHHYNHNYNNDNNNQFTAEGAASQLLLYSFTAKEAIEAIPMIKYFINDILHIQQLPGYLNQSLGLDLGLSFDLSLDRTLNLNSDLSLNQDFSILKLINNNYFKISAHYIACNIGMFAATGKLNLVTSSAPTILYSAKVLSYELLAKQKQINFQSTEDKSIDTPVEFIQNCGFDMITQMALGSLGSLVTGAPAFYDLTISASVGGMQCYNLYNHNQAETKLSTQASMLQTIIPYVADALAFSFMASTAQASFNFETQAGQMLAIKQGLTIMSAVVMTDYMTKLMLTSTQDMNIMDNINNIVESLSQVAEDAYCYLVGECNPM